MVPTLAKRVSARPVFGPGKPSKPEMDQGVVKTYDPITGAGIIVCDIDRSEVYLRPGSLKGSVFRSLRQGQRVIFESTEDDGFSYVSNVRLGQDGY